MHLLDKGHQLRNSYQSLTTLVLFGIIFAACGPDSSARADDLPNIEFIDPTKNATVNVGPLSSKMKVKFKTNNGFAPITATLSLGGGSTISQAIFTYDGILAEYTAEFAVSTGNYANTSILVLAKKPSDSGGNPAVEDKLEVTGITVNKQE